MLNLGSWPKRVHSTAKRCNEYETQGHTSHIGPQEFHSSQEGDFEVIPKLHIPVMVDEVVRCLAPQKGQVSGLSLDFLIYFYSYHIFLSVKSL